MFIPFRPQASREKYAPGSGASLAFSLKQSSWFLAAAAFSNSTTGDRRRQVQHLARMVAMASTIRQPLPTKQTNSLAVQGSSLAVPKGECRRNCDDNGSAISCRTLRSRRIFVDDDGYCILKVLVMAPVEEFLAPGITVQVAAMVPEDVALTSNV